MARTTFQLKTTHFVTSSSIFANRKWMGSATMQDQLRMWHCFHPGYVVYIVVFGTNNCIFRLLVGIWDTCCPQSCFKAHRCRAEFKLDRDPHTILRAIKLWFFTSEQWALVSSMLVSCWHIILGALYLKLVFLFPDGWRYYYNNFHSHDVLKPSDSVA